MAKVCLPFLLWALLCLSANAQKKTIAVIGSSTAAGYGLPTADGGIQSDGWSNLHDNDAVNSWVNRLKRYYIGLGLIDTIYNIAIGGTDIYQAMPQDRPDYPHVDGRPWPLVDGNVTKALSFNPDIILINYPHNNYNIYSVTEIMARYRDVYAVATENGHTVAYVSTTQPRSNSADYGDVATRAKLKELRDSIMAEFPGHAMDFYSPVVDSLPETSPGVPNTNYLGILPQYGQGDSVHLNEAGHGLLYQAALSSNIIPIGTLPLKVGNLQVKRIDAQHISVTFKVYSDNTAKEFFIQVKDPTGRTVLVKVIIPDKTKTTQTISETLQIN